MSFTSRLCANLFSRSARLLKSSGGESVAKPARNYHHMMLVSPTTTITTSSPFGSPVTTAALAGLQRLLAPVNSMLTQVAGFKVRGRLRRRCKDCYFVTRQERLHIICPTHPRHKQMAMKKRDYKSWILTHATQSKVRPY